ncbi:hypothetical protein Pst134EA_002549 [Puccinia striiformis f. sp. tritici]|uniref:hypothetical protein n=1 Tax=Puccinia striiformis f. sp. tritici TaxID=168172 RepID=UPI0020086E44|nr:hypothetical protein Pst134EA_002549 [Puccinia striiformis f. sp. tritici]KAH9471918.1 hypothetical protein Pst134EA_002549 [Puccinia striiformis f. sp. tritici]
MIHNLKVSDDINDTSRRSFEKVVRDIGYNRKEASDLIAPSSAHHPPDMRLTHYTSNVYLSVCLIPQILVAMRGVTLKVDVSRGSIREGPRISLSSTADTSVSSKPPTSDLGAIFRKKVDTISDDLFSKHKDALRKGNALEAPLRDLGAMFHRKVKTRSDDLDNKHKHAWYQVNALGKSPRDLGAIFHEQVNTALDDLINKHVDALYKANDLEAALPERLSLEGHAFFDIFPRIFTLRASYLGRFNQRQKDKFDQLFETRSLTPEFHDTIGNIDELCSCIWSQPPDSWYSIKEELPKVSMQLQRALYARFPAETAALMREGKELPMAHSSPLIREIHQKLDEFDRWEMQDAQEHIGDILEMFCHGIYSNQEDFISQVDLIRRYTSVSDSEDSPIASTLGHGGPWEMLSHFDGPETV